MADAPTLHQKKLWRIWAFWRKGPFGCVLSESKNCGKNIKSDYNVFFFKWNWSNNKKSVPCKKTQCFYKGYQLYWVGFYLISEFYITLKRRAQISLLGEGLTLNNCIAPIWYIEGRTCSQLNILNFSQTLMILTLVQLVWLKPVWREMEWTGDYS